MGGEAAGRLIAEWVRDNGKLVDPALWRPSVPDGTLRGRMSGMQLCDLRPEAGVVPTPSE